MGCLKCSLQMIVTLPVLRSAMSVTPPADKLEHQPLRIKSSIYAVASPFSGFHVKVSGRPVDRPN